MRVYLREVEERDFEQIVKWRNSAKVREHCFSKKTISIESQIKFYNNYIKTGKYVQFIVECIEEEFGVSSYPIATVYLKNIDKENRRCELCIFTSDDQEWNVDSQSLAVKMLLEKAFEEYGMHKVYSYVFYKYVEEADLLKNAGFSIEAVYKEEALDENDKYIDVIRFSIIK